MYNGIFYVFEESQTKEKNQLVSVKKERRYNIVHSLFERCLKYFQEHESNVQD